MDTDQPDVDPSPNTGTYRIGRLSVAIPQLGITASRSGNNIQISAFNEAFPGNDQFFVYVDGFDSFSSNVGLPGPSAFSHLVFGPGSMLANDSLPTSDLGWTFGNFSLNFIASDGTNRQVLLTYSPAPRSQPPSITSLTATPNVLWPPNHKMVSVSLHVAATGDPVPTCQISSVLSSEGGTVPGEREWVVTGPLTVDLRADRAGHGGGRVYTITVTCTNSAASVSQTVMVNVPHDQRK